MNGDSITWKVLRVLREAEKALTFSEQLPVASYLLYIISFNPYENLLR